MEVLDPAHLPITGVALDGGQLPVLVPMLEGTYGLVILELSFVADLPVRPGLGPGALFAALRIGAVGGRLGHDHEVANGQNSEEQGAQEHGWQRYASSKARAQGL